ncbi:hypothetical protein [Streptomyces sp. NPDC006368]|uniref:tachylectin-related carbohydrate-binding protein n=1 Tax=Streptomyces sp. NPDC006368 TaxID=3156760 RepID=UPI0033B703F2
MKFGHALRRTGATLAIGAMSLGMVTTIGSGTAAAVASCGGDVSVYGILSDGRLTYTAISPNTGDRVKTLVGEDLGFTPKAMATLNFNTILVSSTAGELYRIDIQTNNTSLAVANKVKIWSDGWTFDKLTYDGAGHLYGTVNGDLHRYLVTEDKPSGPAHIGQHQVIGSGFVLKTLAAAGKDRLIASTSDGRLLGYKVNGVNDWSSTQLKSAGWAAVDSLVSPGGGLYYGRTNGGMYWYHDADPNDSDGSDIAYHSDDPVDASGWTQTLLSAFGSDCSYVVPSSSANGQISRSEVMSRAKNWYDRNIQYSQSTNMADWEYGPTTDVKYRTDCSGFVSMAWHLQDSLTTYSLPTVSTQISKSDLQPGDILNYREMHVVLFAGWKDKAAGTFYYYSEGNPTSDMNYGSADINSGSIDGHNYSNYVALRYNKIV